MWHFGLAENVVCDSGDQEVFRRETGWEQFLCCSGSLSHVRRPRFYWISSHDFERSEVMVNRGCGYTTLQFFGPKEPPPLWVSPGWEWVSQEQPVNLPTFTRSIPRAKPPRHPAGIGHTDPSALARWESDSYRYPPYTYKLEYCLTDSVHLRVCGAEREALMGFLPGHTLVKTKGTTISLRTPAVPRWEIPFTRVLLETIPSST